MRRLATVRVRTTLGTSTVVGLALLALGLLLSIVIRDTMTEQIDDTLSIRAAELADSLGSADDPRGIPLLDGEDSFTQIVSADGEVLVASRSIINVPVISSAPAGTFTDLPGRLAGAEHVRAHVRDGPGDVKIIVATTLEGVDDVVAVVTTSLWLGLPLLLLLVAGSTWIVTGRTLAPVEAIRAKVADIGHADLHKRVPEPRTSDEVGRLADTMNNMLERLERANERQQRFVSNASHELRTPIATIRHQLEVAFAEPFPDWPEVASGVLDEDLRMQRMVDDLLWLAQHDQANGADTTPRGQRLVDLDEVVFREAQRQRTEEPHREQAITVVTTAIHAGQVRGNADELGRAVRNLVDNAHRHANHRVAIAVSSSGGAVVLHVDDDGPGVNTADRERIFERFTRADEARSRDDGGVGLGLAIAREIATAHGGTLHVTHSPQLAGARFSLTLPTSQAEGRRPRSKPSRRCGADSNLTGSSWIELADKDVGLYGGGFLNWSMGTKTEVGNDAGKAPEPSREPPADHEAPMKAITQHEYGGPELLSLDEIDRPRYGDNEVLVWVRAAGLSPGDRAMLTGVPYVNRLAASGLRRPKNPIPGYDLAGVVEAVGQSVTRFEAGHEVFGNAPGTFAEYAVAAEHQLTSIPTSWTFEQAAAVAESGCVALQAVRDRGQVHEGQRVAVIGAAGGVGSFAVQIAKALGARVTGVCGPSSIDGVRTIGADEVIDYHRQDLTDAGHLFDVVIDTAGKTPLRQLRRAVTSQGRLVIVGADHGHRVTGGLDRWLRALLWSPFVSQTLRPFAARSLALADLEYLRELMERGDLVPVIDRCFSLAEAADAVRYLDHRERPGKVVVVI